MKTIARSVVPAMLLLAACGLMQSLQATAGELLSRNLSHQGIERTYLLYRPAGVADSRQRRPLILVLHGGGGTAQGMIRVTKARFNQLADAQGIYVVYPQGIDKSWNEGRRHAIDGAHRRGIDDVGFLSALIDHLQANYPIDARRVFVSGISNGGMMALRLGCSLPHKIRGIAPVATSIPADILPLCQAPAAVSLVLFNGTHDPLVPYGGGEIKVFGQQRGEVIATARTVDLWRSKNRCAATPDTRKLTDAAADGTRAVRMEYGGCADGAKVVLYRIEGGGHTWPGGEQYLGTRLIGRTSRDIDAIDELWDAFRGLR